jgi:hypothetical protein
MKNSFVVIILFGFVLLVSSCKKEDKIDPMFEPPVFNPTLQYGTVTDIEGNVYKTITIGYHTWMAENLRVTRFNDGSSIKYVEGYDQWRNLSKPSFCWYYNDPKYKAVYGALYNGNAVVTD